MRIIHVTSVLDPRLGGPVTALAGLLQAQKSAGMEVSVTATWRKNADTGVAEQLRKSGIAVDLIGPSIGPLMWHRRIRPTLERQIPGADVVHIHTVWEQIQHSAAKICRRCRRPYVITPHGMLDPWSLRKSTLRKRLYLAWRLRRDLDRASALHFTAEAERDATTTGLNLNRPSLVEPIGIDLGEYENLPAPGQFRKRYEPIGNRPLIVFLGRIWKGKGLEYLIPAMAGIEQGDAVLAVVGPNWRGYQAVAKAMVAEHGVGDRVIFTGALHGQDKLAALADADLFALPSDHENFGIAVVEALAAGTPVIVSNQVSICQDIEWAQVGAVVPTQIGAVADAIDRWLSNTQQRHDAAQRARSFVRERYDWSRIAEHWSDHYQSLSAPPSE